MPTGGRLVRRRGFLVESIGISGTLKETEEERADAGRPENL